MVEEDNLETAPRRRSSVLPWLILILLAAGTWAWFHYHSTPSTVRTSSSRRNGGQTPIVNVTAASRKDIPVYLDGLGTVQAYNTVTVHSQVDGQLMSVAFREGQEVKKGDILAQLDPRTFQAQVDQ